MISSRFLIAWLLSEIVTIYHTSALRVGVRGEVTPSHATINRGHISGLENGRNLNYMVDITLGGQPLKVLIDTGSSDFWVSPTIATANDTGVFSGLTYGLGEVSGNVKTAQLEFLGYTVDDQAFLQVTPSSNTPPVPGMLGLGPNSGSRIRASLNNQPKGDTVLDHIFQQNITAHNILTVLLGRSNDPAEKYPGNITVGEILPGLESITSQPRVLVTVLQPPDAADQHWQVLLDEDGIIGTDGQPIQVRSRVESTQNPKQLTAIIDTGYSFPQVPQEVSSAIYSGIPGASLQSVEGLGPIWIIPCDAEINVTFKLGGQTYPVHPLDTNSDDALTNPDGRICLGAFQPFSPGTPSHYDIIFGTSFLRNVYLLINFGDFVDGSVNTTADPYVQLLSVTDSAAAHVDFMNVRLNHTAPASTSSTNDLSIDKALHSNPRPAPVSRPSSGNMKGAFLKEKIPIIIVSSLGVGLVLVGIIVVCCTRNRLSRNNLANTYRSYQPLEVPAPAGNTNRVQGYHSAPVHMNSWGRR